MTDNTLTENDENDELIPVETPPEEEAEDTTPDDADDEDEEDEAEEEDDPLATDDYGCLIKPYSDWTGALKFLELYGPENLKRVDLISSSS
jgi:hypothetical protein